MSRGEEREALALAREFKLEDKILDLPYAKQRKALELINAGLKGEKLKAEIEKLKQEAKAEGRGGFDPSELVALNKVYDNALDQITGPGIIEGKIIDPKFKEADRRARRAIANRTTNGSEAQALYVDFISDYQRNNFKG